MIKSFLVLAFLLGSLGLYGSAHAMFSDINLTQPRIVDSTGQELSGLHTGQQILIESTLTNNGPSEQRLTYVLQVLNKDGQSEYFAGLSASMLPHQSFTFAQSWIPEEAGKYTVQTFVLNSFLLPTPVTKIIQTPITVL